MASRAGAKRGRRHSGPKSVSNKKVSGSMTLSDTTGPHATVVPPCHSR
jgi:hypothetical protein